MLLQKTKKEGPEKGAQRNCWTGRCENSRTFHEGKGINDTIDVMYASFGLTMLMVFESRSLPHNPNF